MRPKPVRAAAAEADQRASHAAPPEVGIDSEFLDVVDFAGAHVRRLRFVDPMYEGKAADRAAAHGGDNVRVLLVEGTVYPFAEISPEAGTENVGTSVCVKLAYSPSQFVHPLKLIALFCTRRIPRGLHSPYMPARLPAPDCHSADIPRPCAEFSLRF